MSGGASDGAGILTALGQIAMAGVAARQRAKARREMRELVAAAELIEQRQQERRRALLAAVEAQTKRLQAGDATMRDVHTAQHNSLDDQKFVVPIPKGKTEATPFVFGVELDREKQKVSVRADVAGRPLPVPVYYDGVLPVVFVGAMGAGKSTRELTAFFMRARNQSMVIFCAKGTAFEQTYAERAKFSDCALVDPCDVGAGFGSKIRKVGFNPIGHFDPKSPKFRRECIAVNEAICDPEQGVGNHFRTGGVAFGSFLTGWEVVKARRENRAPYLPNVRTMACEPDEWEDFINAAGKPDRRLVGGLSHTIKQILKSGHPQLADMAGKFIREHGKNELAGVISTYETQSRFLHDPAIMECMRGKGADLTRLCDGDRPSTIYITVPPEDLGEFNRLVRLVVTTGLRSHFRPGKFKTVFVLDEFRATVGTLPIIRDLWSVMREYRAQFVALVTSLTQFEAVWGKEWQNMIGQAGAVVLLGPAPDAETAELFSKRCGRKLITQLGISENEGASGGDGAGDGTAQSPGGGSTNSNRNKNAGWQQGGGFNVAQVEVPAVTPQELMSLRPGEGRAWFPNMGAHSVPFFAPHYWNRVADWTNRVGKKPFYKG